MKVNVENLNGHFKKLHVEVPADVLAEYVQKELNEIKKTVELKGFRKGKAPFSMVKSLYSDQALNRAARDLVDNKLREALNQEKLLPVSMPQIEVKTMKENEPLVFSAHFENEPPVELKNYSGFKLDDESVAVTDEEVEKTLNTLAEQSAELVPDLMATNVQKGSVVEMDYAAFENGQPFSDASDVGAHFEIGSGTLMPEFETNLLGMTAGQEKEFTVNFPQAKTEAEAMPVSGKTLQYKVKVLSLKKKVAPVMDAEWVKKFGNFDSLDALKKVIKQDQENQKKKTLRAKNREAVVKVLLKDNNVDAPQTMVENQVRELAMDAGMRLSNQGVDQAAVEEQLKGWTAEFQTRAADQVKTSLLLSAIAQKENIQANDEEFRSELTRMAYQSGRQPVDLLKDLREKGLVGGLLRQITEIKTLDWLVERALKPNEQR